MEKGTPFLTTTLLGVDEVPVDVHYAYYIGSDAPDDPSEFVIEKVLINDPDSFTNGLDILAKLDEEQIEELKHEAYDNYVASQSGEPDEEEKQHAQD